MNLLYIPVFLSFPEPVEGLRGRGPRGGRSQGARLLPGARRLSPGDRHHEQHPAMRQGDGDLTLN